jgi:sec-independent protein translocase protein TatB
LFGITHWIIVLLIALVVFGPEKLPELARTLGRVLADFRRASTDFRRVIEDELYDMERQSRERQAAAAPVAPPVAPVVPALPAPPGAVPTNAAASSGAPPESDSVPPSADGHADRS